MDPNVTLAELREAMVENAETPQELDEWVVRVTELFDALDEWLSAGGFKPADWER